MKKLLMLGAALFVATVSLASSANAQDCICVDGRKCYVVNGLLECDPNVTCEGTIPLTPPIPPSGGANSQVADPSQQQITATLDGPLGPTTITSDDRPTTEPTRVVSQQAATLNPVDVDIVFHATATVEGLRGRRIVSRDELHYKATGAHYPFGEETTGGQEFHLVKPAAFVYEGTEEVVFTLEPGGSFISLRSLPQ